MTTTDSAPKPTSKKRIYLAGALAAGLASFGLVGTASAGSYGGYDRGYSGDSRHSSSRSYESSVSYSQHKKYHQKYSCDYSQTYRYNSYHGRYERVGYNYSTGTWYSCDYDESYEHSLYYNANYKSSSSNNYHDSYNHSNRGW